MRRPVLLIFINAMILIVIFALLTQSLLIVQRLAQADAVAGRVEVQRSGKGTFRALALNDFIKTGDVVKSGPDGNAEFKWADGTRWKILPNTQITVKKASFNVVKRAEQSQLALSSGKVFVRIVKSLTPNSRFEIETPTAVAAVRGTIFSVAVENGKTKVAVFKGSVDVAKTGDNQSTLIVPGQVAVSNEGELKTETDASAQSEFARMSSIVKPELTADVEVQQDGKVLLKGETEAGNTLTVNGQNVKVLGTGVFRKRMDSPADGKFNFVAVDRHGEKNTLIKCLNTPQCAKDATQSPLSTLKEGSQATTPPAPSAP